MHTHSQLTPEARPIVEAAAEIYLRHLQPWFVGLVLHGSALKGGFIAGCSDIDLLLFLDPKDFAIPAGLPLETCLALSRDLSSLDLAPFRLIQCRCIGYLAHPFDEKALWAVIASLFHSVRQTQPPIEEGNGSVSAEKIAEYGQPTLKK